MRSNQGVDGLFVEAGEDADIAFRLVVADIEPELVESIWAGVFLVKPYIAALCLAILAAVGFGDQWAGLCICLATTQLLEELGTCSNIAPLIATTHLEFAVLVLVEIYVVVALQQLVCELGE